jgi:lactoylglutathione lyase
VKLAHIALWTNELESTAAFWRDHFGAEVGELYRSQRQQGFESRLVRLPDQGVTIELITVPGLEPASSTNRVGWAHLALSLGSAEAVDAKAASLASIGLLVSPPRWTGDGFYEAVVKTPEGTPIEVTI